MTAEPTNAAPFTNGGFELPVVTEQRQHVAVPGWDISKAPTCQLYLLGYIGLRAIEGRQLLAISHEDGALGEAVSQTFDTTIGTRYIVQFSAAWTGNPSSRDLQVLTTVKSSAGEPLASTNVHLPAKELWGTTAFSFVAKTSSSTLTLKDNSSIAYQTAIFLDDISVVGMAPAEPCKTMVGGTIANEIWTKEESPYCVTNDVYVSGLLRIREGVEVRFEGNHVFEVAGRLRANGTAEAPIQFHPADPAVGWQGLLFRDAVAGSYFVHTIIEGSKNSGVRITNTPPAFTNCVIRGNTSPGNGGGILATVAGSPLVLAHCQIETNVAGSPGSGTSYGGGVFLSGSALLNDCDLVGNRTQGNQGVGGGLHVRGPVECTLQDSRIVGNVAGGTTFHWGSGVESQDARLRLVNCLVATNGVRGAAARGGGLRIAGGNVELRNCVLAGNANYGVAQELATSLRIVSCTIVSSEAGGVGVWSGTCSITNSILFFNGSGGQYQVDPVATVRFSNIQERHDGEGNISVSPALCPDTFSLIEGSPCVDAGHPGLEFLDGCRSDEPCSPFARGGPRNDMGAYGGPGVCYWTQPRGEPVIRIAPDNETGLVGQPVNLGVIATGGEPLAYQWFRNGSPLAGQTNTVLTIPNAALADAGEYYVKVTNPLGEANSPAVPDWPPIQIGVAQLEARPDGFSGGRPRLLIRNGKAGEKCAIYSTSRFAFGDAVTVPGTPPDAWGLQDTLTFTASEVGWTDPQVLGAGEARYYGVLPAP